MNRLLLALGIFLASTAACAATCQNKDGKTVPIPAADKAEYLPVRDWWGNPAIVILEKGFTVALWPSMKPGPSLSFEEVLTTLDHQSCDEWKFGAAVMLGESGLHSPASDEHMQEEMRKLKGELERKGIVVILVPSA